jgi:hypothetical protein
MRLSEIEALPLHDSTLVSIEMSWKEARCKMTLILSTGKHLLEFANVTMVRIPRETPWGPSASVNGASVKDRVVAIEMQSGDTIEIVARDVEFSAL